MASFRRILSAWSELTPVQSEHLAALTFRDRHVWHPVRVR